MFFRKINLREFPKVELHVHLEGTISPDLIKKLSKKYGIPIPDDLISKDGTILLNDMADFIEKYDKLTQVICCKDAITEMTYEYLKRCANEGAIYVELTVSPDHMSQHNISYQDTVDSVVSGIKKAKQEFDIDSRILIVLVRHLGKKRCEELVETIIANPNEHVVGITLAGDERAFPPKLFVNAFQIAKKNQLKLTAHAGEWTNAKDVLDAINLLGVTRIGHGIHVAFDEKALNEVVKKGVHLELCPTSNHVLKISQFYPEDFKHLSHPSHPLIILHRSGVRYSLNTDDPSFFNNTNLLTEFNFAQKLLKLTSSDILQITLRSIEDSFAPDTLKDELRNKVVKFSKKNAIAIALDSRQELRELHKTSGLRSRL